MPAIVNLVSEREERLARDAKQLRDDLFEKCYDAIEQIDEMAGFALVVWGKDGDMRTAFNAASGPIGPALVPTLAADALNRHVAVVLAIDKCNDDESAG
jgi:hypothetical protein